MGPPTQQGPPGLLQPPPLQLLQPGSCSLRGDAPARAARSAAWAGWQGCMHFLPHPRAGKQAGRRFRACVSLSSLSRAPAHHLTWHPTARHESNQHAAPALAAAEGLLLPLPAGRQTAPPVETPGMVEGRQRRQQRRRRHHPAAPAVSPGPAGPAAASRQHQHAAAGQAVAASAAATAGARPRAAGWRQAAAAVSPLGHSSAARTRLIGGGGQLGARSYGAIRAESRWSNRTASMHKRLRGMPRSPAPCHWLAK